jgi:hypothetical protein
MAKKQIKSKERVAEHGEVFTSEREVNAMLDLVKPETERIESRFLEPACGDGNFLAEILRRKLKVALKESKYKGKLFTADYEKKAIFALCSIYGVELLQDNTETCRERLFDIWNKEYTKRMKTEANDIARNVARFVLRKNILCGDTLTMKKADGSPIIFAQWDLVPGDKIKRRDFRLDELLEGGKDTKPEKSAQMTMDDLTPHSTFTYDEMTGTWMPDPIKEYPSTDYRRITDYD